MFNKSGPVPPGQDGPAGDVVPIPMVPALRSFVLQRLEPTTAGSRERKRVETINISAHEVEINQAGNILRFREYMIHPTEGPSNRVVRCFNGWLDYEEIMPEPVEPSRIIRSFDDHGGSGVVN